MQINMGKQKYTLDDLIKLAKTFQYKSDFKNFLDMAIKYYEKIIYLMKFFQKIKILINGLLKQ